MNTFYQWIDTSHSDGNGPHPYQGNVVAGVSFRDQQGTEVKIIKQRYKIPSEPIGTIST